MKSCPICGSTNIAKGIRVVDRNDMNSGSLQLEVSRNPRAFIFKDTQAGTVKARVCSDCGHVDLYLSRRDAKMLVDAKNQSRRQ